MLDLLRAKNPNLPIYDIYSEQFLEYGRVIENIDPCEIIREAKKIENPAEGSVYLASVAEFESLGVAEAIKNIGFGTLDTQVGYCYGYNSTLGATEWHYSSEINIAVTPLVLILGKRSDIKGGRMSSADMKAFYLPAGSVVEVYATSTHFCPCQVEDGGFGAVVALPRGTNIPLDAEYDDKLLFRKNKWIICHEENEALINRGVVPGIYGENFKINY